MDITKRYKQAQRRTLKNYFKGWWCGGGFMYESGYQKRDKNRHKKTRHKDGLIV